jgi:hypothetical protein
MRILRIICILLLGVLIGILLLYALGWRRPVAAVWLVDPNPTAAYAVPVLNQGELLKWRGTKGSVPFEIVFPYGGPCGTGPILSDDKDEPGVQVASCKVGVVNPAQTYRYNVLQQPVVKPVPIHPYGVIPCPGCQYFPINPPVSVTPAKILKKTTPYDNVGVGCDEIDKTVDVINPDGSNTYQAIVNQPVIWETVGDTASFTLDFGAAYGSTVTCSPDPRNPVAGTSCTFTTVTSYAYTAKDADAKTACPNPSGTTYVNVNPK